MSMLLAMLPTVLLVVFSQLAVKWRVELLQAVPSHGRAEGVERLLAYFADPWIWAAYGAAFLGGVCWLFVVERYAISIAFPIYIGVTVLFVVLGGAILFGEQVRAQHIAAVVLILAGVALAVRD